MQDGDISPTEFHKALPEVEKYRKLKGQGQGKQIEKKQWEEIFEQGRKKGRKKAKQDFLREIANSSGTQGTNAI